MYTASNNELLRELLKELGINLFNKWYKETFGKPAPFLNVRPIGPRLSKDFKINYEVLDSTEVE
tara:strand:- start:435 stop:626 length:192 start_codon:yes stop_codon:yes gene_type:complete